MTKEHQASRTIVKSPPELWAECSRAGSLARHIGGFGEIRITRLDPESTVAWEGEHASGTVEIEPSGWGTRVTLTARAKADLVRPAGTENHRVEEAADAEVEETPMEPDPAVAANPVPVRRWKRLITRARALFRPRGEPGDEERWAEEPPPTESAETSPPGRPGPPPPESPHRPRGESPDPLFAPEVETAEALEHGEGKASLDPEAVLSAALDSLGQAHHRPFSRR